MKETHLEKPLSPIDDEASDQEEDDQDVIENELLDTQMDAEQLQEGPIEPGITKRASVTSPEEFESKKKKKDKRNRKSKTDGVISPAASSTDNKKDQSQDEIDGVMRASTDSAGKRQRKKGKKEKLIEKVIAMQQDT